MGVADLRLYLDWPDHWKTRGLVRLCGQDAPRCLLRLWVYAAESRHDGDLSGLSDMAIADAAGWPEAEPCDRFIAALAELRWIDGEPGAYLLHEWADHQPWIAEREKRQKAARALAECRYQKRQPTAVRTDSDCGAHAARMQHACDTQCEAHCSLPITHNPIQDQIPPTPLTETEQVQVPSPEPAPTDPEHLKVWLHWKRVYPGKDRARWGAERKELIATALAWGFTAEDLNKAITGGLRDPWVIGQNRERARHDDLRHLIGSMATIEHRMGLSALPPLSDAPLFSPGEDIIRRAKEAVLRSEEAGHE